MQVVGNFIFVKFEKGISKESKNPFLVVHLLDNNKDTIRLFVSDDKLISRLSSLDLNIFENVVCSLDIRYYNDKWSVILSDISKVQNNE